MSLNFEMLMFVAGAAPESKQKSENYGHIFLRDILKWSRMRRRYILKTEVK